MKKSTSGFSLVELIVVIAVIAILVTMSIASYATIQKRARDTRRESDLEQIRSALEMYRADNKFYPNTGASYVQTSTLALSSYISIVPDDPNTSNHYYYQATNLVSGQYYGYCLSAIFEIDNGTDPCTPYTGQNYGIKNP